MDQDQRKGKMKRKLLKKLGREPTAKELERALAKKAKLAEKREREPEDDQTAKAEPEAEEDGQAESKAEKPSSGFAEGTSFKDLVSRRQPTR